MLRKHITLLMETSPHDTYSAQYTHIFTQGFLHIFHYFSSHSSLHFPITSSSFAENQKLHLHQFIFLVIIFISDLSQRRQLFQMKLKTFTISSRVKEHHFVIFCSIVELQNNGGFQQVSANPRIQGPIVVSAVWADV